MLLLAGSTCLAAERIYGPGSLQEFLVELGMPVATKMNAARFGAVLVSTTHPWSVEQ